MWEAVSDAVKPVAHLDSDSRLENKIRNYFKKAVKDLEIGTKPWHALIDDYADSAFFALFRGLGEKPWLYQGEADFLLVLDAAVKDLFPKQVIKAVPQKDFERAILAAHDRAFEEQRYLGLLWDVMDGRIQGTKTKKKVQAALEFGQKEALGHGTASIEDYIWRYIDRCVAKLSEDTDGEPDSCLPIQQAAELFHAVIGANALPLALLNSIESLSPDFVNEAVETAYGAYSASGGGEMPMGGGGMPMYPKGFKGKGKGKGKNFYSPY